ncbi:MAG: HD domain-containing protein [Oscillospiraceae bacterium]|nr:HD domain-containing protein [Oscillospiraceae bacterium]
MYLPEHILYCIEKLETAGFAAYAVGGCVRDACLGLTPHDYDLCTSALPEQTEAVFENHRLILAGKKHGTVAVVLKGEVVEITTFRTEGAYADNRHPDWVEFVPEVEEDLARRDFTINAMAYSPTRGYADPFGGQEDLEKGILRAVRDPEERFSEDSLRILRGIRFASRFRLTIAETTEQAMQSLAPLMDNLARERVFEELSKMLPTLTAEDVVRYAPVLGAVIPELKPLIDFDQKSPHHAYDLMTHVAHVVAQVSADVTLRWAALLHDVGKVPTFTQDETGRGHFYGHAKESAEMADGILLRLKAPTALRERVVLLIDKHMTRPLADKKFLRRQLSKLGWEAFEQLLQLQKADMSSKGTDEPGEDYGEIYRLLEEIKAENACLSLKDLAVNGRDLMALGMKGREVGQMLNLLLEQVLDEKLPNQQEELLRFVGNCMENR